MAMSQHPYTCHFSVKNDQFFTFFNLRPQRERGYRSSLHITCTLVSTNGHPSRNRQSSPLWILLLKVGHFYLEQESLSSSPVWLFFCIVTKSKRPMAKAPGHPRWGTMSGCFEPPSVLPYSLLCAAAIEMGGPPNFCSVRKKLILSCRLQPSEQPWTPYYYSRLAYASAI
jgi:hypothetical protein